MSENSIDEKKYYTDGIFQPIAKFGEPIYASIIRNRSGQDSGQIDFGARVFEIEKLSNGDKQDICDTAWALYRTICNHTGEIGSKHLSEHEKR